MNQIVVNKKNMYRQILTPTEQNPVIPVIVPREWYGKEIEIIAFPLTTTKKETGELVNLLMT